MQETIAILHGWPQALTAHWYPWLKTELELKGHTVYLPELPTMLSPKPHMPTQLQYLEELLKDDTHVSLVGHSLGSVVAMRYAEKHKIDKLVVVGGFDYDDLTEALVSYWPNKLNHTEIIRNSKTRFVIHSDNDPYTLTKMNAESMAKRLQAEFILIPGAGHFMKEDGWTEIEPVSGLF